MLRGLLGEVLQRELDGRRGTEEIQNALVEYRPQIEQYEKFCQEMSEKPADVALAWLLHQPVVTAPIIGPRTIEQLTGSLRAVKLKLSDNTLQKLDKLFPGPGGHAPEAYAW